MGCLFKLGLDQAYIIFRVLLIFSYGSSINPFIAEVIIPSLTIMTFGAFWVESTYLTTTSHLYNNNFPQQSFYYLHLLCCVGYVFLIFRVSYFVHRCGGILEQYHPPVHPTFPRPPKPRRKRRMRGRAATSLTSPWFCRLQ